MFHCGTWPMRGEESLLFQNDDVEKLTERKYVEDCKLIQIARASTANPEGIKTAAKTFQPSDSRRGCGKTEVRL